MKILAVEFSSEHRGVAVLSQPTPESDAVVLGEVCEIGGRRAIELVDRALVSARCEREEIDVIAIGIGPGSYTGIRGSISLAQGWQLGRNVKLMGISSVECMAQGLVEAGEPMTAHLIVDAQRNEFYQARYEITATEAREVETLRMVPADRIRELCEAGERVFGSDVTERFPKAKNLYPQAATLGRLASRRSTYIKGEELEPIYLRQADYKKAPPRRIIS